MKYNRISTRVLAVFAAVLLIMTLSVPTFAATEYVFIGDSNGIGICESRLPEGKYFLSFFSDIDGIIYSEGFESPIEISYVYDSKTSISEFSLVDEGETLNLTLVVYVKDSQETFLSFTCNDEDLLDEYSWVVLTPVYSTPSLSGYIPSDILPNVFNEIIALLPLALGALVGFIAIRKAIAYLQNFLHSS